LDLKSFLAKEGNMDKTTATHERNNIKPNSFQYNRRQLRMYYKLLKARMIKPEDIPSKFRGLLIRYYSVPDFWGIRKRITTG
jgi:hypothetical protein